MKETYKIPEEWFHTFEKKLSSLTKRANKLGVGLIEYKVVGTEYVEEEIPANFSGEKWEEEFVKTGNIAKVFVVEVAGDVPKLADWTFEATIQHLPGDSNLIRKAPGSELNTDKYRKVATWCDHCNENRNRKDTYLVRKGKTVKQVGSSCLKDFIGHGDPHKVAKYFEALLGIDFFCKDSGYNSGDIHYSYSSIREFLPYAAQEVLDNGFVSAKKADETGKSRSSVLAFNAYENRFKKNRDGSPMFPLSKKAGEIADSVTEKVMELENKEELNDYEYSLLTIFKTGVMEYRNAGLVTSAVLLHFRPIWDAEREAKRNEEAKSSEHIGNVKDRLTLKLTLENLFPIDSDFGCSWLHKMVDENGNKFSWFSSNAPVAEVGAKIEVTGTVKSHNEWKGTKETQLTRCKIKEVA